MGVRPDAIISLQGKISKVRFGVFTTPRESKSKVKVKFVKNKRGTKVPRTTGPRQQKKSTGVTKNRRRRVNTRRTISRILEKFLEVERSDANRREIIFLFFTYLFQHSQMLAIQPDATVAFIICYGFHSIRHITKLFDALFARSLAEGFNCS